MDSCVHVPHSITFRMYEWMEFFYDDVCVCLLEREIVPRFSYRYFFFASKRSSRMWIFFVIPSHTHTHVIKFIIFSSFYAFDSFFSSSLFNNFTGSHILLKDKFQSLNNKIQCQILWYVYVSSFRFFLLLCCFRCKIVVAIIIIMTSKKKLAQWV